jgi:endonuclease III
MLHARSPCRYSLVQFGPSVSDLEVLLDALEAFHGEQAPNWPTDPYLFLIWWHCGYPASDAACAKGWAALRREIGVEPDRLLAANPAKLAAALKPGGMVPELRAMRLKEIAERVEKEFGGDLLEGLKGLTIPKIRAALKKFPNIADPGADRILLFGGISPVAAVPSNCPHVLVRIRLGQERENYGVVYKEAQGMVAAEVPAKFDARARAYLLLKVHGQKVCKRSNPKCDGCPVAGECAYFGGKSRGRAVT